MRLIIKLTSTIDMPYENVNNVQIQGLIYNLLDQTIYQYKHDVKGFKFFTFSNLFPVSDFKKGESKTLIITSPDKHFIQTIYQKLKKTDYIRLGRKPFRMKHVKIHKKWKHIHAFQTATPTVLYEDNELGRYFSFKQKGYNFKWFFDRLKENALKKYNIFYTDEYELEGDLFNSYHFRKEVAHRIKFHQESNFLVIGSQWRQLEVNPDVDNKFYKFLIDTGLGEKNSLGYGCLNNCETKNITGV